MFRLIKDILSSKKPDQSRADQVRPDEDTKKAQVATCALFIELAKVDEEFLEEERSEIINLIKRIFKLDEDVIDELLELAEKSQEDSISIYEFTDIINKNFVYEEKREVLMNLWRLIYVDEKLHKMEDKIIRTITSNLRLSHQDLIDTKLRVKKELKIK